MLLFLAKTKGYIIKGRGAQYNPKNDFLKHEYSRMHDEGIDLPTDEKKATEIIYELPQKIVNKVNSPDLEMKYSINPYQGCEHGCVYCYARNTHEYWGFSAGEDFETKLIVKKNTQAILEKQLQSTSWLVESIVLSGNTDCYQPIENNFKLTRGLLKVLHRYKHPTEIITKNALVIRDIDILKPMAALNLSLVNISITTLDENLRRMMEPRTSSIANRFKAVEVLSSHHIPVNVMIGPIIPGLNDHDIPKIIEKAAASGAKSVSYNTVRLNGTVGPIFEQWINQALPNKAKKVLNQIKGIHGGQLNNPDFGTRMRGTGPIAQAIDRIFKISYDRHFPVKYDKSLSKTHFIRTKKGQLPLF